MIKLIRLNDKEKEREDEKKWSRNDKAVCVLCIETMIRNVGERRQDGITRELSSIMLCIRHE